MSRFLRGAGAALTAAAAVAGLSAALSQSLSSPLPLAASPSSSPPTTPTGRASFSAHLALVRAHPGLGDLDATLRPASFLIDATQALLAAALRCPPVYPEAHRQARAYLAAQIQYAESVGHAAAEQAIQLAESEEDDAVAAAEEAIRYAEAAEEEAALDRVNAALLDARDGRLDDARDAALRLAAERPGDISPYLFAAALCRVRGDSDVPDLARLEHTTQFVLPVLYATIGSAPRAVASCEELVLTTTLEVLEMSMWSIFTRGDLPERLQVLALMVFLRGVVARKLRRDDGPAPMQGS